MLQIGVSCGGSIKRRFVEASKGFEGRISYLESGCDTEYSITKSRNNRINAHF